VLGDRGAGPEQPLAHRQLARDLGQCRHRAPRVERRVQARPQQLLLVGERAEHGALRDPGGGGDLPGGHGRAVLDEQRQRRGHNRRAPLVRGHRRGSPAPGLGHGPMVRSERSLRYWIWRSPEC